MTQKEKDIRLDEINKFCQWVIDNESDARSMISPYVVARIQEIVNMTTTEDFYQC